MLYFGGGYPGLYFPVPPWDVVFPPPIPPDLDTTLVVEIPMVIDTGGLTRQAVVLQHTEIAMRIRPGLTAPLTRGLGERADIRMRMPWRATWAPSVIGAEVELRLVRGITTRPATVRRRTTHPMVIAPHVALPTTRGLAESVEIPMQIRTSAIMERD